MAGKAFHGRPGPPRFSGVAEIEVGNSFCSGSFVVSPALDLTVDGPAYLFTSGHCILGVDYEANAVWLDVGLNPQRNGVTFRQFADSPDSAVMVGVQRIAFATMKGADLAVVEMTTSRQQLRQEGIVPFVLAEVPPALDAEIALAGFVLSSPSLVACRLRWRAPMVLEWKCHWYDVDADDCLDIMPGASGSAMLSLATGQFFGVLGTQTPGVSGLALRAQRTVRGRG